MRSTLIILLLSIMVCHGAIQLTPEQAQTVGKRIWQNECNGTVAGLTSWNSGEDFASLGIGHFIWYPAGARGPFEESFPGLIKYFRASGVKIPKALHVDGPCPWSTRAEFHAASNSTELKALRTLLAETVPLQTAYLVARLDAALPKMLADSKNKNRVRDQYERMAKTSRGLYAMIDYVNFKGEGVSPTERYKGEGWGLLQVLEGMNPDAEPATEAFARSGDTVLTRRVQNAPADRNEQRWLPGWRNRLKTY